LARGVSAIPIAFGVSLMVGIVFGVFPARKAAALHPLAASLNPAMGP
jgi:ABC-type antimicrobial peptide transport system permease subunit